MLFGMMEPQQNRDDRIDRNWGERQDSAHLEAEFGQNDQAERPVRVEQRGDDFIPFFVSLRVSATLVALACFWPVYRRFEISLTWQAVAAGALGVVLWIGVCSLGIEARFASLVGWDSWSESVGRSALDPFELYREQWPTLIWFLAVRFVALALVTPIVEELFLRGFLIRFFASENWWALPVSELPKTTFAVVAIYAVVTHPAEAIAAVLWFSFMTILMFRTGRISDCIVAHMTTNFLLGIYLVATKSWQLW